MSITTIKRLRWQILDQRCNSRASRNVGSKMLVVFLFCFCFFVVFLFVFFVIEISGLAPRLILLPRRSWRRGHWSSMFPLKFLSTVGKSRRSRCWNEIPVVGECIITHGVLQLLSKSFRDSSKMQTSGDTSRLLEEHPGLNVHHLSSALSAFLDVLQSTPMSL